MITAHAIAEPAPHQPASPQPLRRMAAAPQTSAPKLPAKVEDLDAAPWDKAPTLGPLSQNGSREPADRRTDVRVLSDGGVLYLAARCADPQPDKVRAQSEAERFHEGDCLDMVLNRRESTFPLAQITVNADGRSVAWLHRLPTGMYGEGVTEKVAPAVVEARGGRCAGGWWAAWSIRVDKLEIAEPAAAATDLRFNIARGRPADGSHFAWIDLCGGRLRDPRLMGTLQLRGDPLPPVAIDAPAGGLAVGRNEISVAGWRKGLKLKLGQQQIAVADDGKAAIDILDRGPIEIAIVDEEGHEMLAAGADIRRPLIAHVKEAFGSAVDKPLPVELTLNLAAGAQAKVTIEAKQADKRVGRKEATLPAGVHQVELPLDAKPGEVQIDATAEFEIAGGRRNFVARHWCVVGQTREQIDRFTEGLDKLPTQAKLRRGLADAANMYRLSLTGTGMVASRGSSPLWQHGGIHALALLYKADWPEDPFRGDKRFLAAATAGMEAALDASVHPWRANPDNRSLQAYLLTYELLRGDVTPEQAAYWKARLVECVQAVIDIWIAPAEHRLSRYSEDVGTGTNHWAFHAANVYTAGRVLERKAWLELGARHMRLLARHERDGQFAERRGVPTPSYNFLTQTAIAEYFLQSRDEAVRDTVLRCANFACRTYLVPGGPMSLHDGRVNAGGKSTIWLLPTSLTAPGRGHVATCLRQLFAGRTPGRIGGEALQRLAELAANWPADAAEEPFATDGDFAYMDGLALVARAKGFQYGLSALIDRPIEGLFRLDPQNAVELHHRDAGPVLLGNNSQRQPQAGSFHRTRGPGANAGDKLGERVGEKDRDKAPADFLPIRGAIRRTERGHVAILHFDGFKTRLSMDVLSETSARVKVELVEAAGDEPVIYSFFPADKDAQLGKNARGEDERTIRFGRVTIEASQPVKIERDFRIYHPYSDKFTMASKPTRAFTTLTKDRPLVLDIKVAAE